jgi:hypothetical protein
MVLEDLHRLGGFAPTADLHHRPPWQAEEATGQGSAAQRSNLNTCVGESIAPTAAEAIGLKQSVVPEFINIALAP